MFETVFLITRTKIVESRRLMRLPDGPQNEATRQALLDAAIPIFARDGYQIARIREIATVAGVNLSAINYHFGSKQGLYEAVLTRSVQTQIEAHPLVPPGTEDQPPEQRFHLLVENLLRRFVDSDKPSLMAQLKIREMANPTAALDTIIEQVSKPQIAIISGLIKELIGPGAREKHIHYCTLSLMGQVVFYLFGRPLVSRLFPHTYDQQQLRQLARHIAEFSLAGIKQYRHRSVAGSDK